MLKKFNKGSTILEALVAFVILSIVFTTSLTIIVNAKKQTLITNERINAVNVSNIIRNEIENNYLYTDIEPLITSQDFIVTNETCNQSGLLDICTIFTNSIGDNIYDDEVTLTFLQATSISQQYGIIHFNIEVIYYENLKLTIEGVIYE